MQNFSNKLSVIAGDINSYLEKIFKKNNKYSHLIKPMKYSVFSGGKRFRSAIIVNTGKIFKIDYKKLQGRGGRFIITPIGEDMIFMGRHTTVQKIYGCCEHWRVDRSFRRTFL